MSNLIGSGLVANRFCDFNLKKRYVLFFGDVNDCYYDNLEAFQNEKLMLIDALKSNRDRIFVFFSSCDVYDSSLSDSVYVKHILEMEALVEKHSNKYYIFRLSEVIGGGLDHNNIICNLIKNLKINTKRKNFNLIDIDDVYDIVCEVLNQKNRVNKIHNVASSKTTTIPDLLSALNFLGHSIDFEFESLQNLESEIDVSGISQILINLDINFDDIYLRKILRKYYDFIINGKKLISIIVPTYNEEFGIEEFYRRTKLVMQKLTTRFDYEIIFINDCSLDNTLLKLKYLSSVDKKVRIINFSRNFGNQVAITAGIDYAKGDLAVIIDDDLQDPPEIILNFISKWDSGYKVVYGVRPKRNSVGAVFKLLAKLYYRVIRNLSDTKIPIDTGDFRLVDKVVLNELKKIREENRYYRGLIAWVGFSQIGVLYERDKRYAGVSTFSLKKYLRFGLSGITSFTDKPLYFSSIAGLLITAGSFFLAFFMTAQKILNPTVSIPGWTSLIVVVLFFGGVQLLSIGVVGIYISKIYREVKDRPLYIIDGTFNID